MITIKPIIKTTMAGVISSQNITREILDRGLATENRASHLLHLTRRGAPAFRNNTAISPPNRNAGKLNELRNSTTGVKSSAAPHWGQVTLDDATPGGDSTNPLSGC
jgi:hypothetical protein